MSKEINISEEKYYITGGAGFIGRHLNKLFEPEQVINIDLRGEKIVPNQHVIDIRNIDEIKKTIEDSTAIIHLAASHYDFEKDYHSTNVQGTKNLLSVADEKGIGTFVFFSSVAVYGSSTSLADEDTIPNPENGYGKSKLEAEKVIEEWVNKGSGRKALIIRPAVVFGPHNYGNLFNLTRSIDKGYNIQLGKKRVIKSIAYVKNLADATQYLMENMSQNYEIYNYVDEPQMSNIEISSTIGSVLGSKKTITVPYSAAIILGKAFDLVGGVINKELMISSKRVEKFCTPTGFSAKKILKKGFKPTYNTQEGLIKTTQWFDGNRKRWKTEHEKLKKMFKAYYGITIE